MTPLAWAFTFAAYIAAAIGALRWAYNLPARVVEARCQRRGRRSV